MQEPVSMHVIATMHSAFPAKFGIPRQSGLVESLRSTIVFEPDFRNPDALRGIEGFSHLSAHPGWGATPAWGSSPPAPPSGPTPWACPR